MAKERQVEKNIYLRGTAQYQVKIMVAGRRISETFESLNEARIYRDKIRADTALDPAKRLALTQRVKKREAANETVGKLLDTYVEKVSAHKKSEVTDRVRVGKLKRHRIADVSVYALTKGDVQAFFDWLAHSGASGSSIRRYASLLSHALKTARKKWGMAAPNPLADMELPREGKARHRRLEPGEEERLAEALAKARNRYVLPAWQFTLETAMRRGELLSIQWRDVDLDGRVAVLHDTKNGESRAVPLSPRAVEILTQILPATVDGNERVFPLSEHHVRTAWEAACRRAGITGLRWHDMRREGASRLFEIHGLDIVEAAHVTGHKTLQVLKDHYARLKAEHIARKLGAKT